MKTINKDGQKTGTVKWYDRHKGYGFIKPDHGERDIYVHWSNLEKSFIHKMVRRGEVVERRWAVLGQRVQYTEHVGEKGPYATKVVLI